MRVLFLVALAAGNQLNPITRVAQLLEGLSKKVEADGDAEQTLYDQYKCWCTKVMNSKSSSIEANKLRIGELAAYIDDLENGRVELTSERSTTEDEIKELTKAIAEEEAMRAKENEDYLAAKDEMDKAVAALESAVSTLGAGANTSALLTSGAELKHVMEVGSGFLAKRDVDSLSKILDVPDVDWKKLNREATFKQKYEARSGKIQDILADMLQTFKDNRDEAKNAEDKAESDFQALMGAKKTQLSTAKQALLDKAGETGARQSSLADSEAEKSDLEGQNTRDETFLADTKTACATKATEWAERKRLRVEEVASISQAMGVLRSDDARDLFKKSFDNDSFLQLSAEKKHSVHARAMAMLRRTAAIAKDARLSALVVVLAMNKDDPAPDVTNDPFADVIAAVDQMVTDLKTEEADDLKTKEDCESERMDNTQKAKMSSKNIDTNTETIDRLTSAIAAAEKQIEDINEQIKDLNEEKRQADEQRSKEAEEFTTNKADDEAAAGLIATAVDVLKDFYTKNNLNFMQQEPFVAAGEAPTPPPSTWDDSYGGQKGASNGIIAIMEMVKADIEKDVTKATANEDTAISEHGKLSTDIAATITALEGTRGDLDGQVAAAETDRTTEKGERKTNQGELKATIDYLKSIAVGCDFMAVNFQTRLTNRQAEMDGLLKAKSILQGATA